LEERIESTRSILDELIQESNLSLSEGIILEVSKQLDDLIAVYYAESSI
jgi:hypothetical protein